MSWYLFEMEEVACEESYRLLLRGETDLDAAEWGDLRDEALGSVRTLRDDPEQRVAAAAAYLVGKYGFCYADVRK